MRGRALRARALLGSDRTFAWLARVPGGGERVIAATFSHFTSTGFCTVAEASGDTAACAALRCSRSCCAAPDTTRASCSVCAARCRGHARGARVARLRRTRALPRARRCDRHLRATEPSLTGARSDLTPLVHAADLALSFAHVTPLPRREHGSLTATSRCRPVHLARLHRSLDCCAAASSRAASIATRSRA